MDFSVTYVVQKNGRTALATFEFWNQVMKALSDIRRNRSPAEGTDRIGVGHEA